MKILHIDPDDIDNPLSGGGPVRTYEIYRRLAQRHEITVLTPTFEGATPEIVRDGVRYIRLGRKIGGHGSSPHITFFFAFPRALKRYDYDLLVEDFMPPMSATFTPVWRGRRPLVASVQWWFAEALSQQYHLPFFLGERYLMRLYRRFIVLTEAMKELIQSRHARAAIAVVPNGVDDRLFALAPHFGDFVLYLGRIELEDKGVDLLLRAYARIPERERLPLRLAGTGFQWDRCQRLVEELDLRAWVTFLGKVDGEGRAALLTECRFVCVPSRRETFGMVIAEACAAGKPVVLFDRWPMNEVAPREACILVEPFSIDAYGDAMRAMLRSSDGDLAARGERCRTSAVRYDWDRIALQQEQVYQHALAEAV